MCIWLMIQVLQKEIERNASENTGIKQGDSLFIYPSITNLEPTDSYLMHPNKS